jgi:tripartite-type tricarboxylate transporter receptor subunit TctC
MKNILQLSLSILALIFAVTASAQSFPTKPIKIVVPFPAGGTVDFFARVISTKLSEALGQSVLVENRAGAGGNIAAEAVAKAAPDGYTLLMGSEIIAINTSLYNKLGYDPVKDLAPITLVATVPNILIVHPSLPVSSVNELIALAKKRPAKFLLRPLAKAPPHICPLSFSSSWPMSISCTCPTKAVPQRLRT